MESWFIYGKTSLMLKIENMSILQLSDMHLALTLHCITVYELSIKCSCKNVVISQIFSPLVNIYLWKIMTGMHSTLCFSESVLLQMFFHIFLFCEGTNSTKQTKKMN